MGTDAHLHVEVKIHGAWEHYAHPTVNSDYEMFEQMAGVRGDVGNAIAPPRGIPDDATRMTRFDFEQRWGEDAHTASWLSAPEIARLSEWVGVNRPRSGSLEIGALNWCFLFGREFSEFSDEPEGFPDGLEDVRFVFWFDN